VRVTDHWLVRLFARRPNAFQNWFEWRMMLQGHLVLRGNAYCRITSDGMGGVAALTPIHPDRIRPELLLGGDWRYVVTKLDGVAGIHAARGRLSPPQPHQRRRERHQPDRGRS
jgi:phage portal protein BeeE